MRKILYVASLLLLSLCAIPAFSQIELEADSVGLEDIGDDAVDGYHYHADSYVENLRPMTWQETVQYRLDDVVSRHKGYNVGICVYDLTSDSVLYALKADTKFIPASNQKLLVSIAALTELGAHYDFNTTAYVDGTIERTEDRRRYLRGDIYICGSFDPIRTSSVYETIGAKILSMGIDSIDGRIYADTRLKEKLGSKSKGNWENVPTLLHSYLVDNGIAFTESLPYGSMPKPDHVKKKLIRVSTPLTDVLQRMMKRSDNHYAECMFLNLADVNSEEWSYNACAEIIRKVMRKAGIDPDECNISDGSGLSHSNKVTPEMMVKLLTWAYDNRRVFGPLYASLPIAGVDGTLGRRMSSGPAYKNVRAKTGTVSGVSTLSGYVRAANGHKLVFSILNNNISSTSAGRTFQNEVCQELAR